MLCCYGFATSLITYQIFLGGVVVFAVNSLLYLNQSVPPYGVSLNSQTNGTTAFPLRKLYRLKTHTCLVQVLDITHHLTFCDAHHSFGYAGIQDEVKITLDCSQSDFIAYDKMVISLKGGEM